MISSAKLVCVFFFQNIVSKKFGILYKILNSGKKFFDSIFSILLLLTFVDGIFQKKTHTVSHTHPDWVVVTTKKMGGGDFSCFLTLGTFKTPRRRYLGISNLRQLLLYLSRSISRVGFISFCWAISKKHVLVSTDVSLLPLTFFILFVLLYVNYVRFDVSEHIY